MKEEIVITVQEDGRIETEVKWVALVHQGSEVVDLGILTDEEAEMGIPHGFLSSFTIYPGVLFRFSSPERLQFIVAVDLGEGKVMHVELMPADPMAGIAVTEETS